MPYMNRSVQQISKFIVTNSFLLGKEVDQQFSKHYGSRLPEGSCDTVHALFSIPHTRPDKKIRKSKDVLWPRYFENVMRPLLNSMHIGVEKHNDDAKRAYFSSNKWDAAADIIKTEARIQCLRKFAAAKRPYQKHDLAYWDEGGIETNRASRKKGAPSTSAL